jgi:uncharacterized protein (TIGR00290 family)
MAEKAIFSWSSGKDSALAFYEFQKSCNGAIVALLTTIEEEDRVRMHGVTHVWIERQAESLGLPLQKLFIPHDRFKEEYETRMIDALAKFRDKGISSVVSGDIFLEDLRKYKEDVLAEVGMKGIFPLWKRNTTSLIKAFIDSGLKAIITSVDSRLLDKAFVGRMIDERFLADLPPNVDPCGENGEFHSFVFDGPIFKTRIAYTIGEIFLENSYYFCDLLPVT